MMVVPSTTSRRPRVKFEHVHLFVLVVETGSFTKAADFCGIPKSTISRNISSLEEDLGARLLHRTTRSLKLTETGERFYERAKHILQTVEETGREIAESQQDVTGRLVIYGPTILFDRCRDHIADFLVEHPRCEIEFRSTAMGQRAVLDHRFDLMLFVGDPFDSTFIASPMAQIGFDYYASPIYLEKFGTPESPSDLAKHRCIYRKSTEGDPMTWQFGDDDLQIQPEIICDSPYLVHALAVQGTGVARLPMILAADSLASGELVRLFDGQYAFRRTVNGIYSTRHYLPYKVRVLMDSIREKMPGEIAVLERECW